MACELASVDELVTAELIFNGMFKEVDVDMLVALVSCLVWREKSRNTPKLSEETAEVFFAPEGCCAQSRETNDGV